MKPTLCDCILIGLLLAGGLSGWYAVTVMGGYGAGLVIEVAGHSPLNIKLAGPDRIIPVEGPLGTTMVEIAGNRVRIIFSPCPRHLCQAAGWISHPGETLVCFPNGVVVRITGPGSDDVDAITQ